MCARDSCDGHRQILPKRAGPSPRRWRVRGVREGAGASWGSGQWQGAGPFTAEPAAPRRPWQNQSYPSEHAEDEFTAFFTTRLSPHLCNVSYSFSMCTRY